MSASQMMGVPGYLAAEFDTMHAEAWELWRKGSTFPHWRAEIQITDCHHKADCSCCDCCDECSDKVRYESNPEPEPVATYDKATPELRLQFANLKQRFRDRGFPEPLSNGWGWFYGGGVWFTGGSVSSDEKAT